MHKFKSRSIKNVIGLKISGTLTREEYQEIVPYLNEKIEEFGKIRLLIELDHWEGWGPHAALDDIIFVFKNSFNLERVAFLIKSNSDKRAVLLDKPFGTWFKNRIRYFGPDEKENAWRWVAEGIKDFQLSKEEDLNKKKESKKLRYGPKMNVLVIGGGVAGMTVTALLQQRGFEPRLVETNQEQIDSDHLLYIWPPAAGVLKSLKIYKKVLKTSVEVPAYSLYDTAGYLLQRYDNKNLAVEHGPILVVPHGKLVKILRKAFLHNILRRGISATKLKEVQEGVKVTFSDGTKGLYDCVICTDGLHSKMRDLVFGEHTVKYSGMIGWEFRVKGDKVDFPESVIDYRDEKSCARLVRLGDSIYCLAAIKAKEARTEDKQLDLLKVSFKDYPKAMQKVLQLVQETPSMWHEGFYEHKPTHSVQGRVVFLGKSAYAFLPSAFLNESIALEAALVLADQLSCSDSGLVANALKLYEKHRYRRIQAIEEHTKQEGLQSFTSVESLEKIKDFRKEVISEKSYQAFWKWFIEEWF